MADFYKLTNGDEHQITIISDVPSWQGEQQNFKKTGMEQVAHWPIRVSGTEYVTSDIKPGGTLERLLQEQGLLKNGGQAFVQLKPFIAKNGESRKAWVATPAACSIGQPLASPASKGGASTGRPKRAPSCALDRVACIEEAVNDAGGGELAATMLATLCASGVPLYHPATRCPELIHHIQTMPNCPALSRWADKHRWEWEHWPEDLTQQVESAFKAKWAAIKGHAEQPPCEPEDAPDYDDQGPPDDYVSKQPQQVSDDEIPF